MSRNFFKYLVVSFSVSMIGAPVFGADVVKPAPASVPAAQAAPIPGDLSIEQFKALGFSVVHKGVTEANDNPNTEVYLTGAIHRDCINSFKVTNSQSSDEISGKHIAFRISDSGGGFDCQKKFVGKPCSKDTCAFLSSESDFPTARMKLNDEGDSEISLIKIDPSKDPSDDAYRIFQSFDPVKKIAAHVSRETIKSRAEEAARAKRQARIEELTGLVSACRKNSEELLIARGAARDLFRLDRNAIDLREVLHKLDQAEFKLLLQQAKKASPDEVETLRAQLKVWGDDNPEDADAVAVALKGLALKLVNKKGATPEDFLTAREMLTDAEGMTGISAKTAKMLAKDQDANNAGYLSALGMSGDFIGFEEVYREQMKDLSDRIRDNCYGQTRSMEGCSSAVTAYRAVAPMPQQIQRIYAQRAQEQQKLEMQMAQMLGGMGGSMQQMPMGGGQSMAGGQMGAGFQPQQPAPFYGGMGMTGNGLGSSMPMGFGAQMQGQYGAAGGMGFNPAMGGPAWAGGMYGNTTF